MIWKIAEEAFGEELEKIANAEADKERDRLSKGHVRSGALQGAVGAGVGAAALRDLTHTAAHHPALKGVKEIDALRVLAKSFKKRHVVGAALAGGVAGAVKGKMNHLASRVMAPAREKTAEINVSGVSPERISAMFEGAPPMETVGYNQAKSVLDRAKMMKTAAPIPRLPGLKNLTRSGFKHEDGPPPDTIDKAKRLGGHILAGAGAGRFAAEFTPNAVDPKRKFVGTAIGAGLGAAEFARKAYKQKQWEKKKEAAFSPAMSLKAGAQVGMKMNARPTGVTSIKSIVPKIKGPTSMPHVGVHNMV